VRGLDSAGRARETGRGVLTWLFREIAEWARVFAAYGGAAAARMLNGGMGG